MEINYPDWIHLEVKTHGEFLGSITWYYHENGDVERRSFNKITPEMADEIEKILKPLFK